MANDYDNHERIWLEPVEPVDPIEGRQWCRDNVWGNGVEYVRADLVPAPQGHLRVTDEMVDRAWRAYQDFGWSTEEGMRRAVEAAVAHTTLPHTNDGPTYLDFITPDNVFDRSPDAVQAWQEAKSAEISRHPPTTKTLGCDDGVIATKDSLNVCRAWAELASENERLREILRPFADVIEGISDEFPNFLRVGSINGNFGKLRLGMFRNARAALISVKTPPSQSKTAGLPQDVIDLVIAARIVAFEDQSPEALRALDIASEAFASRVPWDNEPDEEDTVEDQP